MDNDWKIYNCVKVTLLADTDMVVHSTFIVDYLFETMELIW
jgi:hypothetical protein